MVIVKPYFMKRLKNLCFIGCGKTSLAHAKVAKYLGSSIKFVLHEILKSKNFKIFKIFSSGTKSSKILKT